MAENKTRPTKASVAKYLAEIDDEVRRKDCEALAKLMTKVTKQKATMWGPGIVGFGSYHYKYDSGREGDSCLLGFASRKADISVYGVVDFPAREKLLAKLGRHKISGGCLHVRRFDEIDPKVLEQLLVGGVAELKRRHG